MTLDQSFRSLSDPVLTAEGLKAAGIGFKVANNRAIDTTTHEGEAVFGILAALARYESKRINRRTVPSGVDVALGMGERGRNLVRAHVSVGTALSQDEADWFGALRKLRSGMSAPLVGIVGQPMTGP